MRDEKPALLDTAEIVVDESGTVLRVRASGSGARLVETAVEGECALDRIHPDDRDFFQLLCARALRSAGREATAEIRVSRGSDRWTKLLVTFHAGAAGHVRLTLRYDDVRALHRAEEQMRRVVEG